MKSIKSFADVIKKLNVILSKHEKKRGVFVFVLVFVGSILELLSVTAILPFIQALVEPKKLLENSFISLITGYLGVNDENGLILIMGGSIIFLFLFKNAFLLWSAYKQKEYATQIYGSLSSKMLDSYMKKPYTFFLNTNSANLIRGISGDTDGVYEIIQNLFVIVAECITVTMIGAFLIYEDWILAFGALILAFICFLVLVLGLRQSTKKAGIKARSANILASKYAYQAINGIKEITVMNRRNYFVKEYTRAVNHYQKMLLKRTFIGACPDRILEGVCVGGFIGLACMRVVSGVDVVTFIPTLGVFAMAAFKILPSISKIANHTNMIVYYQPALNETYHNIIKNSNGKNDRINEDDKQAGKLNFSNLICLKDVCWRYDEKGKEIIKNCELKISKGESIAFIGKSGAGKTTLADIIMGLLKPIQGEVFVDGINVYENLSAWAKMVGYVPQSIYMIDDSIRNNIAFGLNESEIEDEKVWKALEQAQLKEFVESLPEKLETVVGERGIRFSGGQRQRLALARALYYDPQILILDEATSALDNDTEEAVMEAINELQSKKTLIIVAHRLSTIRKCDRIIEIADGKVIERKKEDILV